MEIRRDLTSAGPPTRGTALTIGAYDGVHLGHRQVIAEVCRVAAEEHLVSAVVTFDRHPATVVRPESAPLLLTDLDQKLEVLATTGVDLTQVVTFDQARAAEDAEVFVAEVLVKGLGARVVAVGEDFHFGRQRQGNVDLLRRMGADLGFEVYALGLVGTGGVPARDHEQVSSSFIRRALAVGELERANDMLGRPYEVRGTIDRGENCGPDLGFPTAIVRVDPQILLPAGGVYAGLYEHSDGSLYRAMVFLYDSFPAAEAFGGYLEAYLIDGPPVSVRAGDGARLRFIELLRPLTTDIPEELGSRWSKDLADTRTALA